MAGSLAVSTHFLLQHWGVVPCPTQVVPQPPQLATSLAVSVQPPLQHAGAVPVVQALSQAPQFFMSTELLVHVLAQHRSQLKPLAEHAALQAPQLRGLDVVSTHPASHAVGFGLAQPGGTLHRPPLQSAPPQSLPQKPQLAGSLSVSTQPPEQHWGETPEEQAVPHAPQLSESKAMSVQPAPAQQPAVARPSAVQSTPQAPQ